MRLLIFIAVLGLAGCVVAEDRRLPAGQYPDYQTYLAAYAYEHVSPAVPENVRISYARCGAARAIEGVTPAEHAKLDAFARGEIRQSETGVTDRELSRRLGGDISRDNLDQQLGHICPESIADFRTYLFN